MDAELVMPNGDKYKLIGTLNHIGQMRKSGHYITNLKCATGKWVTFDDTSSQVTSLELINSTDTYILLFKKMQSVNPADMNEPASQSLTSGCVPSQFNIDPASQSFNCPLSCLQLDHPYAKQFCLPERSIAEPETLLLEPDIVQLPLPPANCECDRKRMAENERIKRFQRTRSYNAWCQPNTKINVNKLQLPSMDCVCSACGAQMFMFETHRKNKDGNMTFSLCCSYGRYD